MLADPRNQEEDAYFSTTPPPRRTEDSAALRSQHVMRTFGSCNIPITALRIEHKITVRFLDAATCSVRRWST